MHEDFYQMYLEELEGVAEAGPEEELALLERLAAGEAEAWTALPSSCPITAPCPITLCGM